MIIRIKIITIIIFCSLDSFSQFTEQSESLNIHHLHQSVLLMGGGATFFDYNSDGFLDLYVTRGGGFDALYRNLGNGKFYDVSEISEISNYSVDRQTSGVISGDINNDGCPDLFITTMDNTSNILLLNKCDGTFEDVSFISGILEKSMSMSAVFLDVNNDSFLDIYVVNYIQNSKFIRDSDDDVIGYEHECFPSLFYINNGAGVFVESAKSYGVDNIGCGLAVTTTDIDNDGNLDIYIANDYGEWIVPNTAYINNFPDKSFTNVSSSMNLDVGLYGMGIAVGDYDNDLDNDFYVSNLGRNSLLKNNIGVGYEDVATELNVENDINSEGEHLTSWGTLFLDIDNDSDLDLFVSNGYVAAAPFLNVALEDPNKIYRNEGNGAFMDVSEEYGIASLFFNRGAIYGDYDNDGDLDIFSVSVDGDNNSTAYSLFYTNQLDNTKNWLEVLLEGEIVNMDAYGALVTIYYDGGILMRENYGGGTYGSQNSTILHFGLNNVTSIDSLIVRWNENNTQTFYDITVNQKIFLKENSSDYQIAGCTEKENLFFNELATYNTGCFVENIIGCTDQEAINYNPAATYSNDQCIYEVTVTGYDEPHLLNSFQVYPNDFQDEIILEFENIDILYDLYIYDMRGNKIFFWNTKGKTSLSIDTSKYLSGVYFIRVNDAENPKISKTVKLVKY
jgi:enediyne biosynthesis protein E4